MKIWEDIVHTAMLGTDKPSSGNNEWPQELANIAESIESAGEQDKESRFLQKAAVVYNYRQCGFMPLQKSELSFAPAGADTKPYCSAAAAQLLTAILHEDNLPLLQLWLTQCEYSNQLLTPGMIPVVLDKAAKHGAIRQLSINCSGNRGAWLSQYNKDWEYFTVTPNEELWRTGKADDRLRVLREVRQDDAAKGLEWLQQTWPQESAATKPELLKTLQNNLSVADLPWLESLLNEKSQKVKEQVQRLLKQLAGSSIVRLYEEALSHSVTLKQEKALLGLVSKTTLQFHLPADLNPQIFSTGIEKLAGPDVKMSDEEYILYQLISSVTPSFWERHLQTNREQVAEYFEKYASDKVQALCNAVVHFKSTEWLLLVLNQKQFNPHLLYQLSPRQQDEYLMRFIKDDPKTVIQEALHINHEWSPAFAVEALRFMVNYPYQYSRTILSTFVSIMPAAIQKQLDSIEAKDPYLQSLWEKNRQYLQKLLTLKQQIPQVFNI
ncbi:DUF5691 domain-containing protein [Mucilaginibacter sp. CSA2-8R]|uniref:DUF5691 domain-containing protein n=1 Tax=Mucilaginibacter sp. CSA2-8R TaxID=3141542 RepID=UPI00315CB2D5